MENDNGFKASRNGAYQSAKAVAEQFKFNMKIVINKKEYNNGTITVSVLWWGSCMV